MACRWWVIKTSKANAWRNIRAVVVGSGAGRTWRRPMSVARVGWYPTADGMRPKSADTSEPA